MSTGPTQFPGHERQTLDGASSMLLRHELGQLQRDWMWFFLLGLLLELGGMASIVFPVVTVTTSLASVVFLGILLMATGIATILGSYSAGRWSGLLLHVVVGILYLVSGFLILDSPNKSEMAITLMIAVIFMLLGICRIVGTMIIRFPRWGWSLLNGVITLLAGVVIYRHFPESALWVIGLIVGLEMLFSGLTWVMLALAVRQCPRESA
jgi:uncharacterized membrane protein HdeD (DUF308 family)